MKGKGIAIVVALGLGSVLGGHQIAIAAAQSGVGSLLPPNSISAQPPAQPARAESLPCVTRQLEVNAPVDKVWQAIQNRRSSDPQHRQLLSYDGNVAVVKETFSANPIIGSSFCTYAEHEIRPLRQIAYTLVASPRFRKFEGCWTLTPGGTPNTTLVSLSFTMDPGIRFPFWDRIARNSMQRDVRDTLQEVNRLATATSNS